MKTISINKARRRIAYIHKVFYPNIDEVTLVHSRQNERNRERERERERERAKNC